MSGRKIRDSDPPRPRPLWPVAALLRTLWQGEGNLLSLLPASAYRVASGPLGYSRRSIILFNDPISVRQILEDREAVFPKSDLMVGALEALIGESIFVSDGEKWRRQRAMIDPAFSHMRLSLAFRAMRGALMDHERHLDGLARSGEPFSLDLALSHLTADIICRTVFSVSLDSSVARDVFHDFLVFERHVAQVGILRLIVDPAWKKVPQKPDVLAACTRIRGHLGALIDRHDGSDDIAAAVMAARDKQTDKGFSREELIDQLGVFFLAGHETTASALTWAFYILATRPDIMQRLRAETEKVTEGGDVAFEHTRRMPYARAVFQETLRLYPPITFIPRVALRETFIGGRRIRRGALVMIAPWTLHRHKVHWRHPDRFDPERFLPGGDFERSPGAFIPFGAGPHTCVGAGFATAEAILILASLARRFDFDVSRAGPVRPVARLTTRPAREIMCTLARHHS
ncbi:cytochrome P450 [Hyphomonas sp.]|uniref:cytochrome P450 n=1 Tax=Hyphomonas sp. TaxID=87 RepID=UPI003455BB92